MTDFKPLIALLQKVVDDFNSNIPDIQDRLIEKLRLELKDLDLDSRGNIKVSVKNVRKIAAIKSRLLDIVLTPAYKKQVAEYIKAFQQITDLQNQYFATIEAEFEPPAVVAEIQKQAIESVVDNLTERGIQANIIASIEDILRTNITGGGSYSQLATALENNVVSNGSGDGSLSRYAKQITTDAVNQYSAQYTQTISNDLGYEWFYYAGSNIMTTRPFCLACTKKRYIHISEFPALLKGEFAEFEEFDGKLNKSGQPAGMIADTTPSNFPVNRGGHNCGHQLRPINEQQVPKAIRDKIIA